MTQNRSRAKGDRFEGEVVKTFLADGIPAQRVPLSGAAGGMFGGDVQIIGGGGSSPLVPLKLECKVRARAWKAEYGWLEGNYALVVKRDRSEPLVIMRLSDFTRLIKEPW